MNIAENARQNELLVLVRDLTKQVAALAERVAALESPQTARTLTLKAANGPR